MVLFGLENLSDTFTERMKGMRVGIITNNVARNKDLQSSLEIVRSKIEAKIFTLLTPEHGYFGDAQDGVAVESGWDENLKINVESLYRDPDSAKKPTGKDVDFDIGEKNSPKDDSKYPSKEIMDELDCIICDLQDIGCRIYTNMSTMVYSMSVCREDQEFVVLDRPNPINGVSIDGPILKESLFSFIGTMPIPLRHSLTMGELAKFFNEYQNKNAATLSVVPVKGWKRDMWLDQTGMPWILPSPNMPSLQTANIYPGTGLLSGTNISEGRGTTLPFQIFGAPFVDGIKLKEHLNKENVGVKCIDFRFRPTFSKYEGKSCGGILATITERDQFKPFEFALSILSYMISKHDGEFAFDDTHFDKASGDERIRKMLLDGKSAGEIEEHYRTESKTFLEKKQSIEIYRTSHSF